MQDNPIVIIIFLVLSVLAFLLFKRTTTTHKASTLKKAELIKKYEYEMLKIITKYEKDTKLLKQKKVEYLKAASHELHNNIFFDESEAKAIIKKLASL